MSSTLGVKKRKKKSIKLILQIIFFAVLTVFAVFYVLKDDPKTTFSTLARAKFFPILIAIIVILVTLLLEGLALKLLTNIFTKKYSFGKGLINTLIGGTVGVYVKTAAPLLQAYVFSKQDVPLSNGASVLTMNFMMYQLSLCVYSLFIIIFGYPLMKNVPIPILWDFKFIYLVLIGFGLQLFFLVSAILLAYCRPLHRFILNTGINFLAKLHILRNPEATRKRLTIQFATYRIEMKRLSQNIPVVIEVLLINIAKQFLLGLLPFICFLAFAPTDLCNRTFFAQSLVGTGYTNIVGSFLTVGAPEIVFQDTFSYFLKNVSTISDPIAMASAANICWRTLTFYLVFVIGIVCFLSYRGSPKRYKLLSNTATIYDLELHNLDEADEETKAYLHEIHKHGKKEKPSLLTKEEIESSFLEIRELMTMNEEVKVEETKDKDFEEILEEQRLNLVKVEQEYQDLVKNRPSQSEIEHETEKDIRFQEKQDQKKRVKKKLKAIHKKEKQAEKQRKALMKKQPKGSTMTFDEQKGINIKGPEFTEYKTLTTHDPDEDSPRGRK